MILTDLLIISNVLSGFKFHSRFFRFLLTPSEFNAFLSLSSSWKKKEYGKSSVCSALLVAPLAISKRKKDFFFLKFCSSDKKSMLRKKFPSFTFSAQNNSHRVCSGCFQWKHFNHKEKNELTLGDWQNF